MPLPVSSKVHWHVIDKVGYPPADCRVFNVNGNTLSRTFLIKDDYQIRTATCADDGSCFYGSEGPIHAVAWAVIDGF